MEGILGTNNTVGLVYLSPIGIGTKPFLCFEIHGCVSGRQLRTPEAVGETVSLSWALVLGAS